MAGAGWKNLFDVTQNRDLHGAEEGNTGFIYGQLPLV